MTDATTTLFRPVGQAELDLIRDSGWREFPPRLPHQPIFYPVTTLHYASKIARRWNANEADVGVVGYVTRFHVRDETLRRYPVQIVGGREHAEHWVPADELAEFNANIVGTIEVVAEFREDASDPGHR